MHRVLSLCYRYCVRRQLKKIESFSKFLSQVNLSNLLIVNRTP